MPGGITPYDRRARLWEQVERLFLKMRRDPDEERAQGAARRTRCLQRQARILELHFEASAYRLNPEFIANYSAAHAAALVDKRREIVRAWLKFCRHPGLVDYLQGHAEREHLLRWAKFEITALAQAEQLAMKPPPSVEAQTEPKPPKKKLTAVEIRAYKVRRAQEQAADKIALKRAQVDAILQARSFLAEYDLDPGERERLETELIEDILEENTDGTSRKETL
jgi:hypothetical protein